MWGSQLRSSHLTANEQILHVSLWSLLAAPLLIGCDLSQLDTFTLDLLTNDEVIDIDQDVLGIQAHQIAQNGDQVILARPLSNGTYAVGLFNKGLLPVKMTVNWSDIPLTGSQPVRDVWKHKNLGLFKSRYSTRVSGHASVLLIVGKPAKEQHE